MESQTKKLNRFSENTVLLQNLFSLNPEIKTGMIPERKKMNKVAELERRLFLFHQAVELLKESNKELKAKLAVMASSS